MSSQEDIAYEEVRQTIRALRAHALSEVEAFGVSLAMLAWAKRSVRAELPAACDIEAALRAGEAFGLEQVLERAANVQGNDNLSDLLKLKGLDSAMVQSLLASVQRLAATGRLDTLSIGELLPSEGGNPWVLPAPLVSVITRLAGLSGGEKVYAPWDFYGQLAMGVWAQRAEAYVETPIQSNVPHLIQMLGEVRCEIHHADPILSPSARNGDSLHKFEVSLAFPPIGLRYGKSVSAEDRFERFPEKTSAGGVLSVRHMLAQTRRRVVVVVPNSFLSNSGAERDLRNAMLARGVVESVIGLPAGLFEATMIATAVLVLDPKGGHEHIRFINVEDSRFYEATSKARWKLVNGEELADLALRPAGGKEEDDCTALVATSEALHNDGLLQVNRYVLSSAARRITSHLAISKTVVLGELVQTVRSLPPTVQRDVPEPVRAGQLREVGASDLPVRGCVVEASRQISIDQAAMAMVTSLFLKPWDIVLVLKGSAGKVGIVGPSTPESSWIVGQSGIVLRVRDPHIVDPRALFMLLRSPMGQQFLKGLVAGTTVPLIQLRGLLALGIPVVSPAEQAESIEALETERQIQIQIDQLRAEQHEAAAHLWPMSRPSAK